MSNLNKYINLLKKHGVRKGIEYLRLKITLAIKEKKFVYSDIKLRYIFENADSDVLIIVFSAFSEWGVEARYNYVNRIEKFKVNKLWILDEYGPYGRGCYYLGKNNSNTIYNATYELIKKIKETNRISKTIYVGSSKGGHAALNFGFNDTNSTIIVGAPQYLLGTYLTCNSENKPLLELFKYITGKKDGEDFQPKIKELDSIIAQKITPQWNGTVYLHYSNKEHTYSDNIIFLINDLKKNNITLYEEKLEYLEHGEVAKYFPSFLIESLNEIINDKYCKGTE